MNKRLSTTVIMVVLSVMSMTILVPASEAKRSRVSNKKQLTAIILPATSLKNISL